MKKLLLGLMAVVLVATSCSKENSFEQETETAYFVRFKVGGTVREYTDVVLATTSTAGGVFTVTIQGQADLAGNNPEGIVVTVADDEPVVAQTYSEVPDSDTPAMMFRDDTGKEFSTLFATTQTGLTVNLSRINSESVRGSFSGKAYSLDGNELEVTEGTFFAKFQ
ncbi:hypothetical protein [Pseudocnuella soli]|uniref:hypothetical protein n=1 Tax=Pseudocnuella soli TaxID=2502779 RepID=UPI00104FE350|nr:hypothetical protein [Pseudocnuella soli]